MGILCLGIGLTHFKTGEFHLEILIQRKLNGNMCESQEGRRKTRVKGADALSGVHLLEGVKSVLVMPWWTRLFGSTRAHLRHQSRLHNPYRIGDKRRATPSSDGGEGSCEPYVLCRRYRVSQVILRDFKITDPFVD